MSYKFFMGATQFSGTLTQTSGTMNLKTEGELSASSKLQGGAGTLSSLTLNSGGITAAGAIAGATTIDASGDLTCDSITNAEFTVDSSGNTDIDGTLNVEGIPTFQAAAVFSGGITTANAIAGATTISGSGAFAAGSIAMAEFTVDASGNTDIDGTLNVQGVPTFQAAAVFSGGITTANAIAGATTIGSTGAATLDSSAAGSSFGGSLTVGTDLAVNGNIDLGNAITDSLTCLARFDADLIPLTDSSVDLGTTLLQFAEAHIDTGNIDSVVATTLSASSTLVADGNVSFGADLTMNKNNPNIKLGVAGDTALDVGADLLYFRDATDKYLKTVAIDSFCTDIAGAGLSEKNGQLVVDGQGTPALVAGGGALKEGYNYMADNASSVSVGLPASPTAGDVVHLKLQALSTGVKITLTSSTSNHRIDGEKTIAIEAGYAAVSFLYGVDNKWFIV